MKVLCKVEIIIECGGFLVKIVLEQLFDSSIFINLIIGNISCSW